MSRALIVSRRLGLARSARLGLALLGAMLLPRRASAAGPDAAMQMPDSPPGVPTAPGVGQIVAVPAGVAFRATLTTRAGTVGTVEGRFNATGEAEYRASGPRDARTRFALIGTRLYFTFAEQWRSVDATSVCTLPNVTDRPQASGPPSSGLSRADWLRVLLIDPVAAFGGPDGFAESPLVAGDATSPVIASGMLEVSRLIRGLGSLLSIDDACAAILLDLAMDYADLGGVAPGLIPVSLTLAGETRAPQRLRFTLRDLMGRELSGDVELAVSESPFAIVAPA